MTNDKKGNHEELLDKYGTNSTRSDSTSGIPGLDTRVQDDPIRTGCSGDPSVVFSFELSF